MGNTSAMSLEIQVQDVSISCTLTGSVNKIDIMYISYV